MEETTIFLAIDKIGRETISATKPEFDSYEWRATE